MEQNKLQIDIREHPTVTCDECGSLQFVETTFIKKISKFVTGSSSDEYVPIKTYACKSCGHINDEFNILEQ